jgi:hypothetical protein
MSKSPKRDTESRLTVSSSTPSTRAKVIAFYPKKRRRAVLASTLVRLDQPVSSERLAPRVERVDGFRLVHVVLTIALLVALLFALGRVAYYLPALIEQLMRLSAGAWR